VKGKEKREALLYHFSEFNALSPKFHITEILVTEILALNAVLNSRG
jgi:hypothetical protein